MKKSSRKGQKVFWGTQKRTGFGFFKDEFKAHVGSKAPHLSYSIRKGQRTAEVYAPRETLSGYALVPVNKLKLSFKKLPKF